PGGFHQRRSAAERADPSAGALGGGIMKWILAVLVAVAACGCAHATKQRAFAVSSPDGLIAFKLSTDQPRLRYAVYSGSTTVIENSPLVFVIDKVDLTIGAKCVSVDEYSSLQEYPTRGAHSKAINRYHGASFAMQHGKTAYTLEVRAS